MNGQQSSHERANRIFAKIRYIIPKQYQRKTIWIVLMLIVGAAIETLAAVSMLPFMNALTNPAFNWSHPILERVSRLLGTSSNSRLIALLAFLMAILHVIKGLYKMLSNVVMYRFISKLQSELSSGLFNCFLHKPYSSLQQRNSAIIQRTVATDVPQVAGLFTNMLRVLSESVVTLFMFALLIYISPIFTLMGVVLIIGSLLLINRFVSDRIIQNGRIARSKSIEMIKWIQQSLGGLKNILANQRQQHFIDQYAVNAKEFASLNSRFQIISGIPQIVVESASMAGIFFFIGILILTGMEIGSMIPVLATFAVAAIRLMPAANRINSSYHSVINSYASVNAVYNALTEDHDADRPSSASQGNRSLAASEQRLQSGIKIEHISFRYPTAEEPLFEDVSLDIPAGKSVALVGMTGSGKTTMADIILGLQRPYTGSVLVDGKDICIEATWWASLVGYVPQSVYLIDNTIRANVAFGYPMKSIDDNWVWQCLADAQMKEFVSSLPQGLDTVVGERGTRLSGGQQQRIGIARALYSRPAFIVMDEATSSVDQDTEKAIIDSISLLAGQKTLLIIAHRLSTIQKCDLVYRIEDGRVQNVRSE